MDGYWFITDNRKKLVKPEILAKEAKVPLEIVKAFLSNNIEGFFISKKHKEYLYMTVGKLANQPNRHFWDSILPTRWWIREYMTRSGVTPENLSVMLDRSLQSVRRWMRGNEKDLIPLTADDIKKMDDKYELRLLPYYKEGF